MTQQHQDTQPPAQMSTLHSPWGTAHNLIDRLVTMKYLVDTSVFQLSFVLESQEVTTEGVSEPLKSFIERKGMGFRVCLVAES